MYHLDLLLENRKGLEGEVMMVGDCLGYSDHELVEFKVIGARRKKVNRVVTLDFKRANFKISSLV